jgi:hypothetical protein
MIKMYMNDEKITKFIIDVIDDKAVQIQLLRLTPHEAKLAWDSFTNTINNLYNFEVPAKVQDAIELYMKRLV